MTIDKLGAAVVQDRAMAREPRSDGPRRRTFSPAEKLALLAGYETAMETGQGNGFLREHGLYSSLISRVAAYPRRRAAARANRPVRVVGRPTRIRRRSPGCAGNSTWRSEGWRGQKQRW